MRTVTAILAVLMISYGNSATAQTSLAPASAPSTKAARSAAAPRPPGIRTPSPEGAQPAPGEGSDSTYASDSVLPEPTSLDELQAPSFPLPTDPIEPFLLLRNHGPFMVLAHTFRGPDAPRYAQALAMELRQKHSLPAYVYFVRIQPGRSNIRNVPPTADARYQSGESIKAPESYRSYDEAAVLVGNCKTIDESEDVLKQVKKIHSVVIDGLPSIWSWRKGKGLSRAMLTTNPLVGSEDLFPGADTSPHGHGHTAVASGEVLDPSVAVAAFQAGKEKDPLLDQMNGGSHSALKCPGPYLLEVASFLGRTTTDVENPTFHNESFLKQSPLAAAADKAEHLASSISKCKSLPVNLKPYVYHDRYSSRVYLGPFQSPTDPALKQLLVAGPKGLSVADEVSVELLKRGFTQLPMAPARQLTPRPSE